jgi:phosphoribosylglycinamide formyltransferase-1
MSARRIAVFASGSGRSVENLAEVIRRGDLQAEIVLVLSDRREAGVLARAERLGLARLYLPAKGLAPEEFSARAFAAVEAAGGEFVVLAGFLRLLVVPERWRGRVINIHPSLLPAFGGQGFYGERVHAAVLARGVQFSGCTVHLVDEEYDHGRILLQRVVEVEPEDTVESLAARVFEAEKLALPEALRRLFGAD